VNYRLNYIKYVGETTYTSDISTYGWYCKVSETILTKGKTYRLLKSYELYVPDSKGDPQSRSYDTLYIEDDVLLNKSNFLSDEYKYRWEQYTGAHDLNLIDDIYFITNREHNLDILNI
jgi:hypothetical protein